MIEKKRGWLSRFLSGGKGARKPLPAALVNAMQSEARGRNGGSGTAQVERPTGLRGNAPDDKSDPAESRSLASAQGSPMCPHPRWFHFTPDRFLIGLLVAECLLWLSQQLQWFGFNHHKGWTVLITVGMIGVAMLVLLVWFAACLLFRRRFRFGVRSLLVSMVVVAVSCAWFAVEVSNAKSHKEAREGIQNVGGEVVYDWQVDTDGTPRPNAQPPGPGWLPNLLGDDFFTGVVRVYLTGTEMSFARLQHLHWLMMRKERRVGIEGPRITDADLEHLKGLTQLKGLSLGTHVTDAGMEHLKGLTQLQELELFDTKVTDAGLKHLKCLTQLRELDLCNTPMTDAGLEHIKGLTKLKVLELGGTKVTDTGLEHLKCLTQLQELGLSDAITDTGLEHISALTQLQVLWLPSTKVTDAGLEHLKGLAQLQKLCLCGTKVTDAGLERLKELPQLRELDLSFTQVTDAGLEHLKGFTQLQQLNLAGTKVTDAGLEHLRGLTQLQYLFVNSTQVTGTGVNKLQQALPKCKISH